MWSGIRDLAEFIPTRVYFCLQDNDSLKLAIGGGTAAKADSEAQSDGEGDVEDGTKPMGAPDSDDGFSDSDDDTTKEDKRMSTGNQLWEAVAQDMGSYDTAYGAIAEEG